jgi:hypothetical protein
VEVVTSETFLWNKYEFNCRGGGNTKCLVNAVVICNIAHVAAAMLRKEIKCTFCVKLLCATFLISWYSDCYIFLKNGRGFSIGGRLFGSSTVSSSNHLPVICTSTSYVMLFPAFLALCSVALYWRPLCSSTPSVTMWMHCWSHLYQKLHSCDFLFYFVHFSFSSCDFSAAFILTHYCKCCKKFLSMFLVVFLGVQHKWDHWARAST